MIIGAGSTLFEMVRHVADRLLLIPLPPWADYHMDPISIRDALHYLVHRRRAGGGKQTALVSTPDAGHGEL